MCHARTFSPLGARVSARYLWSMTKENQNEKQKSFVHEVPTVSRVLPDGRIIELVYLPQEKKTCFAVYDGGKTTLIDSLALDGNTTLIPVSARNNLIKHRAVLLPGKPEEFGDEEQLRMAIESYLYRYVDLSDSFRALASCYIMLSWVYDAFNELPYLRLRGDYGCGKTRALLVIGSVCYKPFFASGASTVSPIFHTLNLFQGTLIFDEADFRFSDEKAELTKILNNGNVKGFPVLRTAMTEKKEFDPRAFLVYGPKIVGMRNSFDDQALESRFLTEDMGGKKLRSDIPINLPQSQELEAQTLRSKLLQYRFQTLEHVSINKALVDPTLSPRLNQILVPLLSIIDNETVRQEIRGAAQEIERDIRAEKSAAPEGELLTVLAELIASAKETHIPLAEITALFIERHGANYDRPITPRYVGSLIRKRLRLFTYKYHGVYVLPITEKLKIEALCARYGISSIEEETAS